MQARPWDDSKGYLRPLKPLLLTLLDLGGHAKDVDREGRSPLAIAVLKAKRLQTVKLLLDHKEIDPNWNADPEDKNPYGLVPDSARTGPHTSDPELADKMGHTPLYHAIKMCRVRAAALGQSLGSSHAVLLVLPLDRWSW